MGVLPRGTADRIVVELFKLKGIVLQNNLVSLSGYL